MMVSANSASCTPAEPRVAGPKRAEELPYIGIELRPAKHRQHAGAHASPADQQRFKEAGDKHAPGRGMARSRK